MPDKSSDRFPRLPSVSDVLDAPQVRAVIDRVSRTTVASTLRGYMDQVRNDLKVRLEDASLPHPAELAERLARFLLGRDAHRQRTVINATGKLISGEWSTVPLAEEAQLAMLHVAGGFTRRQRPVGGAVPSSTHTVSRLLCQRTRAESALVVHSYSGALWLTFRAIAAGREIVVARSQYASVDGIALPELMRSTGALLKGVGSTDQVELADVRRAVDDSTVAFLHLRSDAYRVEGDSLHVPGDELVTLAREYGVALIHALDNAPLVSLPDSRFAQTSASASIAEGADVVVVKGQGMVGGPPSGLILGRRDLLEKIEQQPLHRAWQLDELRLAALTSTLKLNDDDGERALPAVPVRRMMATPIENLRHRAERLAPQLATGDNVQSAEPMYLAGFQEGGEWDRPQASFGVVLLPNDGRLESLCHQLLNAAHPIVCYRKADQLVLDLRTVLPDQDALIVDGVTGASEPAAAAAEEAH